MSEIEDLGRMSNRFAPVDLEVDTGALSAGNRAALAKLVEAALVIDRIFLEQRWSGNLALEAKLKQDQSELGRARLDYFRLNKGPWSELDEHSAFLRDVPARKPQGGAFYPEDMTREEFEGWGQIEAKGFFSVIRRGADGSLRNVPYSVEYAGNLKKCAGLLREAAGLTEDSSLRQFLMSRAEAFLSDDYYESDVAWMDLDSAVDVTIGPYETYNDELFGYKAGFEAYINIRDDAETAKVKFFGDHMQEVEDNLPIEARYRNPKIGGASLICVVNQVIAAGDAYHGVAAAAYVLPNDERIVQEKGSKRVMLKNVQEAKFGAILTPISKVVLAEGMQQSLSFDAFFTHILAHEMAHGIGPHRIVADGRETSPRQELKELYSALEEAKADILGLFMLRFFHERGYLEVDEEKLYATYLASSFRTMRFGLNEAHGKGMALQFNYLASRGAIACREGCWEMDVARMRAGVQELAHDLLTIEATGDYAGAKNLLETPGVMPVNVGETLNRLANIPVDIRPRFVTANEISPEAV
jgi:hypothetical protein